MKEKHFYIIGILLFLGISIFLTFNRHSRSGYFNYHSEIWNDKAGYYVYLPATFKFNFNAKEFPDSIDHKTGEGFLLDKKSNKVLTKYTYGVALMQSPFFLLADLAANPLNHERTGFSPVYHWSINIASVFYLVLGLAFLMKFLIFYFNKKDSLLTILSIFIATNLYYYSIDETGMSHVYSFSLFCLFLYYINATKFLLFKSNWKNIGFGFLIGLIVLIRPTNILFLSTLLFLDIRNKSEVISRIKGLLRTILPTLFGIAIVIIPQLIYWNYVEGTFIHYSYKDEGFNLLTTKIFSVWFAPRNGLFLYTPFYFIIITCLVVMIKNKKLNGLYILALFCTLSYVLSSWWDWGFGCSFGSRSHVEYLSIYSIPVAYGFSQINQLNFLKKFSFFITILILIIVNLKMSYKYDGCFYGEHYWDWNEYITFFKSL